VENSLDAAESINILPSISVNIVERTQDEHNLLHGIRKQQSGETSARVNDQMKSDSRESMYYTITVIDNGCGISSENIGNMLGRVLSGSKHGIRQTRGKFGLGAKMALIWSKKSSGLPIFIRSAHSTNPSAPPATVSEVTLDIDIYNNTPRILRRADKSNPDHWRGTEITMTMGGLWSTYRSKMLQYFQQLAVITPYAELKFSFDCLRDVKRSISLSFDRRADTMPSSPLEMLPHPRSLNHITLTNLLRQSNVTSITKFLTKDLCGISSAAATTIISHIDGLDDDDEPSSLSANKISALYQALHRNDSSLIKPPSASGLSPAGVYNLRLGVMKELQPKLVATFADKPSSHEVSLLSL
jgi:DNA topoisomerase VI subunit B